MENNSENTNEIEKFSQMDLTYQPLSYDSYKFFIKFSPYIEKLLVNNINKGHLKSNLADLKSFSKLDCDLRIKSELINYLNVNKFNDHKIKFSSKGKENKKFFIKKNQYFH